MVHGGAGALENVKDEKTAVRYLDSIRRILEHGREVLSLGGSALQAVEQCASLLEDDPIFNAGCGSVLNEDGRVEMDAAIMDGQNLLAGAVAGVDGVANPVQLARLVMTKMDASEAADAAIGYLRRRVNGRGGLDHDRQRGALRQSLHHQKDDPRLD